MAASVTAALVFAYEAGKKKLNNALDRAVAMASEPVQEEQVNDQNRSQSQAVTYYSAPALSTASSFSSSSPPASLATSPSNRGYRDSQVYLSGQSKLVSPHHLRTLIRAAPKRYSLMLWSCVYQSSRDGISLTRFIESQSGLPCALVIIKDMKGTVLGGFASQPFVYYGRTGTGAHDGRSYYGSGECFVFRITKQISATQEYMKQATEGEESNATSNGPQSSSSAASSSSNPVHSSNNGGIITVRSPDPSAAGAASHRPSSQVDIYRWVGSDDYFLLSSDTHFGMGGGTAMAWQLDVDLRHGTSGACSTFDSPTLSSSREFEMNECEVWCPTRDQLELEIDEAQRILHPAPPAASASPPPSFIAQSQIQTMSQRRR